MTEENGVPVTELPHEVRLQRAELDIICFTTSSISLAFGQMLHVIKVLGDRRGCNVCPEPTDGELTTIFNFVWTIIFNLDILRKTIKNYIKDEEMMDYVLHLKEDLNTVKKMRDGISHLDSNAIANKISKIDFPLLGVLTLTLFDPDALEGGLLNVLDHLILSHSDFHARINFCVVPHEMDSIRAPADYIRLHAFGNVININRVVTETIAFADRLKERIGSLPGPKSRLVAMVTQNFDPPLSPIVKA